MAIFNIKNKEFSIGLLVATSHTRKSVTWLNLVDEAVLTLFGLTSLYHTSIKIYYSSPKAQSIQVLK